MTDKLPGNLLALFTPRPPPRHLPHVDYDPAVRHTTPITGIAAYLQRAEEVKEKYQEEDEKNPPTQSWLQLKDQQKANHLTHKEDLAALAKTEFHPKDDPNLTTDPLKTIIVARLARDADKKDLEREFGRYGPIDKIKLIQNPDATDEKKKSRCYAFVTFEKAGDAKSAIRDCEGGITIRGRRSIVDVERGRTVPNWLPRRYGGGLGGRHYTKVPKPSGFGGGMYGGAPSGPGGFRGGFRDGGRRGGFGGGGGDRFGGGGGGGRFGGGDRRDGGGFRGNGFGGPPNGAPNGPNGAPSGPRGGGRSGGYGGGGGSYGGGGGGGSYGGGGSGGFGGGDRYDDRARGSGSNREPLSRGPGTRYHDRDGAGDDYSRKRGPPEGETEDPRQRRRY